MDRMTRNCSPWLAVAIGVALLFQFGCTPPNREEEASLETVDLAPAPVIDPDLDPRAKPRQERLAGTLPGSFPEDVPLILPASVDAVQNQDGWIWITLATDSPAARIQRQLATRLRDAGWSGALEPGLNRLTKGGRSLRVELDDAPNNARYRIGYQP